MGNHDPTLGHDVLTASAVRPVPTFGVVLVLVIMPTFALHELVAYRDRVLGPQSICVTFAC